MKEEKNNTEEILDPKVMGAYTISVDGSEGEKIVYLKEIPKQVFYKVFPKLTPMFGGEAEIMEAGEIILRECAIGGDVKVFLTNDEYTIAAAIQCVGLVNVATGSLKKN